MVVSHLRPGTGVLPYMLNESEGTLMDELRNGFQKPKPNIVNKDDIWTQTIPKYKNNERCSKYNFQMQRTRLKEQLCDERQQMIVVDD